MNLKLGVGPEISWKCETNSKSVKLTDCGSPILTRKIALVVAVHASKILNFRDIFDSQVRRGEKYLQL